MYRKVIDQIQNVPLKKLMVYYGWKERGKAKATRGRKKQLGLG